MTKTLKTILMAAGGTLAMTTAANAAHIAYSLGDGGSTLVGVAFDDIEAGDAEAMSTAITLDGASLSLDAVTFRPQTGEFYGYDGGTGTLYTVDPRTGAATVEFQNDALPSGFVSFDTNTNLDAFRFVNAAGDNVVYFPQDTANGTPSNAGRLITDAPTINPITYADGYENISTATGTPQLIGNGYTNQLPLVQAQAQSDDLLQYVLDAQTDSIAVLDNNAGTIDFEGFAGFDFDVAGGFDVFTNGDTDIGYALLTVDGEQALYSVDLVSYVFTQVFEFELDGLVSLAVFVPGEGDVVPLPAAALLFPMGIAGLAAARRKNRAA